MKPTRTSTLLRSFLKDLGSEHKVCHEGHLKQVPVMPNPSHYTNHISFARDYQAYNIARKRVMETPTATQMRTALGKWVESEHRCKVVNDNAWWVQPISAEERDLFDSLLQRTQVIISDVLCDRWPVLDFAPTSGSTATLQRKYAFAPSKVDGTPLTDDKLPHKCAPASRDYLEMMMYENPGVARRIIRATVDSDRQYDAELKYDIDRDDLNRTLDSLCRNVSPARLGFVPKDAREVRLIAKSNTFSIMVQKTFGRCIRESLYDVGIDLNDQTINQEWAEIGSHTGLVATVDLSAASDSISTRLIGLFPRRWQSYFLSSRDTHVSARDQGKTHKLAMIAGMGNGYIFELESLLFYAMTKAVVEELHLDTSWISVYGDDIICPAPAVQLLERFFLSVGFLINTEKSFSQGPFRESCGKHYFNGHDVTPWFVRSDLDRPAEIYHNYNGLAEWSSRTGNPMVSSLNQLFNCLKKNERTLTPASWGSKTGLYEAYAPAGCLGPITVYSKRYQRDEIVWRVLVDVCETNLAERMPVSTVVVGSLMSLDSSEPVVPPHCWQHLYHPERVGWPVWKLTEPRTSSPAQYTWGVKQSWKKHRA